MIMTRSLQEDMRLLRDHAVLHTLETQGLTLPLEAISRLNDCSPVQALEIVHWLHWHFRQPIVADYQINDGSGVLSVDLTGHPSQHITLHINNRCGYHYPMDERHMEVQTDASVRLEEIQPVSGNPDAADVLLAINDDMDFPPGGYYQSIVMLNLGLAKRQVTLVLHAPKTSGAAFGLRSLAELRRLYAADRDAAQSYLRHPAVVDWMRDRGVSETLWHFVASIQSMDRLNLLLQLCGYDEFRPRTRLSFRGGLTIQQANPLTFVELRSAEGSRYVPIELVAGAGLDRRWEIGQTSFGNWGCSAQRLRQSSSALVSTSLTEPVGTTQTVRIRRSLRLPCQSLAALRMVAQNDLVEYRCHRNHHRLVLRRASLADSADILLVDGQNVAFRLHVIRAGTPLRRRLESWIGGFESLRAYRTRRLGI